MSDTQGQKPELRALLHQAHALVERRRFTQARAILASGLQEFPESSQLQYLAAFVDYSEGKIAEAVQTVRTILARDPQHHGARVLSGELHNAQKEYPQAESVWIDLLREYPEDADCYAAYAELMLRTLHIEKAQRLAQEGLRFTPNHERCLYVAALIHVIYGRSRADENEHLQRLLQDHPERVNTLIALIVTLDQQGDSRSALRVAQQLLRTRPDSEQFAELVRSLQLRHHWSLLPLYPMQRWGWAGAGVVTVIGIIGVRCAERSLPEAAAAGIAFAWIAYVIYSWIWPRLLRKFL